MAAEGSVAQVKLVLLVVSALRLAAATLPKTSTGECYLVEVDDSDTSMCCSLYSIMAFEDNEVPSMPTIDGFKSSPCQPPGAFEEEQCEENLQEKTLQEWIDQCHSESKHICINYLMYEYECEAPDPDPLPNPPTTLPPPTNPGTALVFMPQPDPLTMCVSSLTLNLCDESCSPYGTCEEALVALSEITVDEGSTAPDTTIADACKIFRDTVLAAECPQCVDAECVAQPLPQLFSEGPSAGGWPFGRGAGGTTTTLALAGVATAAVLFGAAVLRKRRGVRALAGEPLTAGADSGEASDAVEGPQ